MAKGMTQEEREQLLAGLSDLFLKQLVELVESKTASSTDRQLIYKVLQDNGMPLADICKALGLDNTASGGESDFIKNLPFRAKQG